MPTQSLNIPLRDYATGERTVERAVPVWTRKIKVALNRCTTADQTIWPNIETKVSVLLEASFDNGATWQFAGSWGGEGGIFVKRDGTELAQSFATFPYPGDGVARVTFTVTDGPCHTSGAITVSDV